MILITQLTDAEKPALKAFSAREWPSADREHFGDTAQLDWSKPTITLAAKADEDIVGYITIELDMGVIYMESLIVAESHRGQGIARQLVTAAEEWGRSKGAHKISLETGANWKAKDFYLKLGYAIRAELPDYYAHRDYVLMDKDL